ncbi:hypothetical protein HY224_01020 [Candidatus Uhrbacteria bacterium]|nr:hypothetical protein [Candidatus Uhrbacteria bacterium]
MPESGTIITNPNFDATLQAMVSGGRDKLHVLTDFDHTLTKGFIDGKKVASLVAILRENKMLSPDYPAKAHAVLDKYYPFTTDPTISQEEKKKKMYEWYYTHFKLIIASGFTRDHVKEAIDIGQLELREGVAEALKKLHQTKVPVIIISSSGLGGEAIEYYLQKNNLMMDNMHVVSNVWIWDAAGKAAAIKEPIIFNMNKDEIVLESELFYPEIIGRPNVLLIGNAADDVGMLGGRFHHNVIKVGFLDDKVEEKLPSFKENFDVVLLDNQDFSFINGLLAKLL